MFKETVILAERAAEAGLTQDARFPMMKNQSKSDHHGDTEARRRTTSKDLALAPCPRGELILLCALPTLSVFPA